MHVHFDTAALAEEHLTNNGWHKIQNGNYVSRDGTCAASIHPAHGEVVAIRAWEIAMSAKTIQEPDEDFPLKPYGR
jgi:hypothetical protein